MSGLDTLDRAIVRATQAGLPLDPKPYHRVAEQVGATPAQVIERLRAMLDGGVVRRIGAVPNHYALGYLANGMTVWDVVDDWMDEAGRLIAALDYVTHCYHRPRHPPDWPYNLFAMVHAKDRETVAAKVAEMGRVLGPMARGHEVLYSTRILKKTGLRIGD